MGCTQSKIDNEETVTRCKERKLFMKDAVSARNAFAAAHSAYSMSLKNTGAALSDYAHGEVQFPNSATPSVPGPSSIPQPPLPPPPPPLPDFQTSTLQRAASMPEISITKSDLTHSDPIIEEENEDEEIELESHSLRQRSSRSSGGGGGGGGGRSGPSRREVVEEDENLPPPLSPPRKPDRTPSPPSSPSPGGAAWDFFFPEDGSVPGPSLVEVEDSRSEREELERKMFEGRSRGAEADMGDVHRGDGGKKSGKAEALDRAAELPPQPQAQQPPQPPPAAATTQVVKRVKQVVPAEGSKRGGKSVNLLQIFSELDDCFLRASECAHEVSKMLEANRLHYHSNFADNRGHIDHSARVMRVITWNRSFRGLPNTDDVKDDFDSEENETHATVLDKMLAWEKKLYDEVKAGEQMKLEYQRKVASLNKLKKRGSNTESLERMKASVSHLHTRYIVDMQSMDSTVSEINRLRDEQLYPKLVALVDGMAIMWETMRVLHENQSKIVVALRSLDISQCSKETSDHHHERTTQLLGVVEGWHKRFEKLITHQKEYITSLKNWLKLNLIPIDNNLKEKVSFPQSPQSPPIQDLVLTWHDCLDKLPDELARTAIFNFGAVVNTIVQYQVEEMKLRDKCEYTRKEIVRKQRQYDDWYNKYMQRRTPPDEMDPDRAQDNEVIAERKLVVEALDKMLEEDEDAYKRQCIQVRDKSLTSLKSRLPEIFRAMSEFSYACSDMYRNLRNISHRQSRI